MFSYALAVTITLNVVSVLIAQYFNQMRLAEPVKVLDATGLSATMNVVTLFAGFCFVTSVASLCYFTPDSSLSYVIIGLFVTWGELCVSMYLCFSLWLLLMDLHVSSALLDQLHILAEEHSITLKSYTQVRNDIRNRYLHSRWSANSILFPCVASIVTIVFLLTISESQDNTISWILLLVKELVFVGVAFSYVARVNSKADDLTEFLSEHSWRIEDKVGLLSIEDSLSNCKCDMERLTVHAAATSRPIAFYLMYKRISWQNVAISAASLIVSLMITFIKKGIEDT